MAEKNDKSHESENQFIFIHMTALSGVIYFPIEPYDLRLKRRYCFFADGQKLSPENVQVLFLID
jgi:hypothetical protein